jgi:maleylacetate reductase
VTRVFRFGWGAVAELPDVLAEVGVERPVLVTTRRARSQLADVAFAAVFDDVSSHVPEGSVRAAIGVVEQAGGDGVVALGGGSAVDTAKAVALAFGERGLDVRVVAVPTTYAAAEWTHYFGVLDETARAKRGGSGDAARPIAAVYDPSLTLGLPLAGSVGTALNALAHCAEAFYAPTRSASSDRHAHCGARAISHALPLVAADGASRYGRTRMLEGAMRSAWALAESGMGLAHAMAQAVGGRYGAAHGAANAVCLASALRYNAPAVPEAFAKLAAALPAVDPIERVEELARLGGFARLRDLGVPEDDLEVLGEVAAARPAARANPRPATAAAVAALFRSVW